MLRTNNKSVAAYRIHQGSILSAWLLELVGSFLLWPHKSALHWRSLHSGQTDSDSGPLGRAEVDLFATQENAHALISARVNRALLNWAYSRCFLPLTVVQSPSLCFLPSPSDSSLISMHTGGGADSHSGSYRMHKHIMVPLTDTATVGGPLAARVVSERTLPT